MLGVWKGIDGGWEASNRGSHCDRLVNRVANKGDRVNRVVNKGDRVNHQGHIHMMAQVGR